MSAEPIDIEVRDKVASGIRDKLLNLAQAALEGANSVDKLNKELEKIDGSSLNKLVQAQKLLSDQTLKNNNAYLQQETALNKAIAAEAKAASSVEKLAAAQARAQATAAVGAAQQAEATQRLALAAAQAESAQIRAAAASAKSADAALRASNAVNAFGETESEVAARLSGVANAGAALAKQQQAIGITAVEAANSEKQLTNATKAAGGAATDAASRYSNYMSALNTIKKNSTLPPNAGIPDVSKIDKATDATNKFAHANAGVTRELIVLGHEAVTGNFSRIPGSLLVLAERTNGFGGALKLLSGLFTSIVGIIGLAIVALGLFVVELFKAEEAQRKFNDTARLTGNIAGLTIDSYEELAKSIATTNNVSIISSKEAVTQLAESGRFQKDQIAQLADSAIKLSKITGQATDEIIKDFINASKSPAAYAQKVLDSTGLISAAQLQQIKELEKMGDTVEATRVLSENLYESLKTKGPDALHGLEGAWNSLKIGIDGATQSLFNFVRRNTSSATLDDQIGKYQNAVDDLTALKKGLDAIGATGAAGLIEKQITVKQNALDNIKDVKLQLEENAKTLSETTVNTKLASQALDVLDSKWESTRGNAFKAKQEIDAFNKALATAQKLAPNNPVTIYKTQNADKIRADIQRKFRDQTPLKIPATAEETRDAILTKTNAELDKQLKVYGDIREVREANQKLDQIDIQLATHTKAGRLDPLQKLSNAEKEIYLQKLQTIETNKRVEASEDKIYTTAIGPLQTYNDGVEALNILNSKHLITTEKVTEAQKALDFAYQQATDPLFTFNRELKQQNDLLESNLDAKQRSAKTAVNQINNQLAPQGKKLTDDQAAQVEKLVLAQQHLNEVTQAYDQIIAANRGAQENLVTQQEALNKAYSAGEITTQNYATATTQLAIAKAKLNLDQGLGDATRDLGLASIGKLLDGYKNVLSGLSDAFGDFFKTLDEGFANSVAHAIVFGGSLKDALLDVARQGVEALISSLIKLGIQWVIQQALGTEVSSTRVAGYAAETVAFAAAKASQAAASIAALGTVTAANVAAGITVAEAWAAAATLVSLASYGANAIPAAEGISATYALTAALAAFKVGGYTGDGGVNDIAGLVHGKEFVVNATGTAANRSTLEAMNRGETVNAKQPKITIEDHTTGGITWEQKPGLSADEVRLIARNEVNEHAPNATAAAMQNPNSKVSKSMTKNYRVQREHA